MIWPLGRAARLRAAAQIARRIADWPTAAARYRDYLALKPRDARAWVQYGHAAKESGELDRAEGAYRQAIALRSGARDAPVHLAHLLKRRGEMREASAMFLEMFAQNPSLSLLREVEATGAGFQARAWFNRRPPRIDADGIFIEIGDLLRYLAAYTTLTGIPRVATALVRHALETDGADLRDHHFVERHGDGDGLLLLDKPALRDILDAVRAGESLPALERRIDAMRSGAPVFRLASGDTYLIAGAFWEYVADPSWIGGMRARGVVVGAYIYDLIPVTHAHYCVAAWADAFVIALADLCRMLDFALTISAYVADELRTYLERHGIPAIPIVPVRLAHELGSQADGGGGRATTPASTAQIERYPTGRFVLYVSTIEARKNHRYLFDIWRRLLQEGLDVPALVFVGRAGWQVDDLIADIEASRFLDGRLHILSGLSDDDLDALYARCLFTVFPSFVEGWGLPVGESLARGKLCVASSRSSVPEVGGAYATYVDPFDVDAGYDVIRGLLKHPDRIVEAEARIAATFRARTWADVGGDFFAAVGRLVRERRAQLADRMLFAPHVAPAAMLDLATLALPSPGYAADPQRLILASGWTAATTDGAGMREAEARLRLATPCPPGAEVRVVIAFDSSAWVDAGNVLSISTDATRAPGYRAPMRANATVRATIDGRVSDRGILAIDFAVSGEIVTTGGAIEPVALRLRSVGYAPAADRQACAALQADALPPIRR